MWDSDVPTSYPACRFEIAQTFVFPGPCMTFHSTSIRELSRNSPRSLRNSFLSISSLIASRDGLFAWELGWSCRLLSNEVR